MEKLNILNAFLISIVLVNGNGGMVMAANKILFLSVFVLGEG